MVVVDGEGLVVKVGVEIIQMKKAIQKKVVGESQLLIVDLEMRILDGVLLGRMPLPLVVVVVDGKGLAVKIGVETVQMKKAIHQKVVGESQLPVMVHLKMKKLDGVLLMGRMKLPLVARVDGERLVVKVGVEIAQTKKVIQLKLVGESQLPAMMSPEMKILDGVLLLRRMQLLLVARVDGERLMVKVGGGIAQTKKAIQKKVVGESQLPAVVELEMKVLDGVLLMRKMQQLLVVRVNGERLVVGVDGEGLVVKVGVEVAQMKKAI